MTIATLIPYITTQPRQKSKRLFSSQRDWTEQAQYEFVVLFVNHHNQEQRTTVLGAGQLVLEEEDGWGVDQFTFYQNFGEKVEHLRAELLSLLKEINREEDCTVVMVTHSQEAARYGDRTIFLRDGRVEKEHC